MDTFSLHHLIASGPMTVFQPPGRWEISVQQEVSFDATSQERALIKKIANRAKLVGRPDITLQDWQMDIMATHANGNPLRLADLLAADDFNFMHDVYGINACLDRETGRLLKNFRPRFSVPATRTEA